MTKKVLSRVKIELYHYNKEGKKISGAHKDIRGDVSGIYGDVSGIYGNVSGIYGYVSGIYGDVDQISKEDREKEPNINEYVKENDS